MFSKARLARPQRDGAATGKVGESYKSPPSSSSTENVKMRSRGVTKSSCLLLLLLTHLSAPVEARRGAESLPLGFTAEDTTVDNVFEQAESLKQSLSPQDRDMKLHFLKNASVTCNDGSPAGYYLKESKGSKRWLLFLEGGWYCFSKITCDFRFKKIKTLMGSFTWPQTTGGKGILSSREEGNPYWWNANKVFIVWFCIHFSGGYAFMGSLIIREVVNELLTKGLDKAQVLLLAGSSSGGIGVLVNVDHVAQQLESQGHRGVQVRGLSDSGWVVERKKYKFGDCTDILNCGPISLVKRSISDRRNTKFSIRLIINTEAVVFHRCPMFVVQCLFDQAQFMFFNGTLSGEPTAEGQWNYLLSLGQELRSTAVFAPSCLAHEFINQISWMNFEVKGTSLPNALHCWDQNLQDNNHPKHKNPHMGGCPQQLIDSCTMPHCNPTCQSIYDEGTERDVNASQLLKYMSYDVPMTQWQRMEGR
uniref:Notum, palmitoleoyl-protein carboxylesterase n=1 Tax=Mola mola TaxID=94237 RepID=A0A3Q4AYU2_MOLML